MRHVLFNNNNTVDDGTTTYNNPGEVPDEQIAILDADNGGNLDLTGANATDKMIIVQGNADGQPVRTQIIEKSKIKRVISRDYEAPQKQITHVGFDGADGTILNGEGEYILKVVDVTDGYEPYPIMNLQYSADANDTEYDIAVALAKAAIANPRFFVQVDALSAEATTQLVDTATPTAANVTLDVTEGSRVVVANVTSGADVNASAGDYIRIGDATDDLYPLYKIESVETNDGAETQLNITLDRAYAGESATGVAAGSTSTAPADGDAAGLSITGATPAPENEEGIDKEPSKVTSFRTALSEDFGDTEVQATQTPKTGSGSYAQLKFIEENSQGGLGLLHRMTPFKAEKPEFFADRNTNYDVVSILVETNTTPNIAKSNKYVELVLAYDEGANIGTQLETFFGVS